MNTNNEEILDLLRENARLSVDDISAMTKRTPDEVRAAMKQLEDDGIIMKYAAIVNPEKDGEAKDKVRAEIEIQVTPERDRGFDAIADRIWRFPQVKSLYLMSGGYDLKVIIEGRYT
jgi:DNA-binding Lrp family transcriptional regulator